MNDGKLAPSKPWNYRGDPFSFPIGRKLTGEPLFETFSDGRQMLIAGASGSGKSAMARSITLSACKVLGQSLQVIVIDPKRISFMGWDCRVYVYTDERDWIFLIDSLLNEMRRRYAFMAEMQIRRWRAAPDTPMILLVVEEMAGVTCVGNSLTKSQRDELVRRMTSLSNQMRQCGMSAMYVTQTPDVSVIPAAIRNNCTTRIGLRLMSESAVGMITGDRQEEARCDLLRLPGQFYAMTGTTQGMFVRGRAFNLSADDEQMELRRLRRDKRNLPFLEWDSPDYLG